MAQILFFITLVLLGYYFGKMAEKSHYKSLRKREKQWLHMAASTLKTPTDTATAIDKAHLVTGSVVISIDYFKRILAGLRNLFGGNVHAYETLVDRARREAILRMKESCPTANQIINVRLETSSIAKGNRNQIGSVEVLASGTAIFVKSSADPA